MDFQMWSMEPYWFSHSVQQVRVCIFHAIIPASKRSLERKSWHVVEDIYCASRSLYGLARDGQAPGIFARTTGKGTPIFAVAFTSCFTALGFLNASKSASQVFGYLVDLVTVFAVLNWLAILVSHIAFRRALKSQGISIADLPYHGPLQPYSSYFALFIVFLVIIFKGKFVYAEHDSRVHFTDEI